MPTNSSGGVSQHHTVRRNSHSQQSPPKHLRTHTAPEPPTLLRLPSTSSAIASAASRSRRATLTSPSAQTTATSYFPPQSATIDAQRRPPASHSGHGMDNSRGPPITLVTRGKPDIVRRNTTNTTDFAYAQQRSLQSGLISPGESYRSIRREGDEESVTSSRAPHTAQQTNPNLRPPASRRNSTSISRPTTRRMASSDDSSDYSAGPRSRMEDYRAAHSGAPNTPDVEKEDLFMNIAADTATRVDRLKVRRFHASFRSLGARRLSQGIIPQNCSRSFFTWLQCLSRSAYERRLEGLAVSPARPLVSQVSCDVQLSKGTMPIMYL
jgi:hypothetical protein